MTDFKRYLLDEFVEDYQEGMLTRREALKLIAGITGSLALASSILAACAPPTTPLPTSVPAIAPTVRPAASQPAATAGGDIAASDVQFAGDGTTLTGCLGRPTGSGPLPAVLVCHENRGLTDHIKDVTRRFARAGYVALAVDLLSRQGGTAAISDASSIPGLLSNMPQDQFVADFTSGWRYLQSQPYVQPRVGMVGFCFGGGVTWRVAIGLPDLRAAVPFYGPPPSPDEVAKIQAAVLAIYGERDQRITSSAATMEAAMRQYGKTFEKVIYPNANHAFFNDTGQSYNPEAAKDAWARTLAWLDKYLKSS